MTYTPPRIWTQDEASGGKFASINSPTSGARFDQELPVGKAPLQLYSLNTPNGIKVNIMLLELLAAGIDDAAFDAWQIKIDEGDQFGSGFVDINPNSKIPALVDYSVQGTPIEIFESGAILVYLSQKFNRFLPQDIRAKTQTLNWLFWQMGAAPFVGGGFGHFYAYAPKKLKYPIDRYAMETKRQLDLLDKHLKDRQYIAANQYTIADMAIWPWYGKLVSGDLYDAGTFLQVDTYTHLTKWHERISLRDAVKQAVDLPLKDIRQGE